MESIIDQISQNKVDPKEFVFWLRSSVQITKFAEYENLRDDFVPLFLNFLRDETVSFLHNSNIHAGFGSSKFTSQLKKSKNIPPDKFSKNPHHSKKFSSKAKILDFSKAPTESFNNSFGTLPGDVSSDYLMKSPELNGSPSCHLKTPQKIPPQLFSVSLNDSPIISQSSRVFSTSTPRIEQQKIHPRKVIHDKDNEYSNSHTLRKSEKKNVLADYIVRDTPTARKLLKNKGGRERPKELNNWVTTPTYTEQLSELDINDREEFPVVGSTPLKKGLQKKKRINPTKVATLSIHNSPVASITGTNFSIPFGIPRSQAEQNVFLMATEIKAESIDHERKLLMEQREKLIKEMSEASKQANIRVNSSDNSSDSLPSLASLPDTSDKLSISQVTFQEELNVMAEIYSSFILLNMVSNFMVELYFIFHMLTVDVKINSEKFIVNGASFFNSCQNCIYFAVKTLSFLTDFLSFFDRSLIRALNENVHVLTFDLHLHKKLTEIHEAMCSTKPSLKTQPKSPVLTVSFQSETDNKNNFPTANSFHMFRKQRDLFYETLRIWEDNHLIPDWSFGQKLGSRVKQILSLESESTNLTHLARLFQSQLLTMSKGDEEVNMEQNNSEDISFLFILKKQNPEKFKKLYDRLITPSKFGGPVPKPSFHGSQEFFRDFIVTAANYSFNVHLKNVLVARVADLNQLQWQIADIEERELEQQGEHLRDQVIVTIASLRLLGKFLGFLEFLPYQASEPLPDIIISNHSLLRHKVMPPMPLLKMLKEGIASGSLVIVVPWIVELLSMADPVTFHTRYYLTLIFGLILIYKVLCIFKIDSIQDPNCFQCQQATLLRSLSQGNCIFLRVILGWLLSLPNVPDGLFYLQQEEVDLEVEEYEEVKRVLFSKYASVCPKCVCSIFLSVGDQKDFVSPIKTTESYSPIKTTATLAPFSEKGDGVSPLKTPSKFLRVSMIDTPEVTPDKPNHEASNAFSNSSIDSYNLFDSNVLYTFCPFVHELKAILNDFALGHSRSMNGGGNVRKITPLSAPEKNNATSDKAIQILLEENFFHNQPSSAKKSVDFATERIFSNILRSIRSFFIPSLKDKCVNQIRSCVTSTIDASTSGEKVSEIVEKKVHQLSNELSLKVQQEVSDCMAEFLGDEKLKMNLKFLLPIDMTANSLEMCCMVVKQSVQAKMLSWMNSHLATGFCTKELMTEAHKYMRHIQKVHNNNDSVLSSDISSVNISTSLNTSANDGGTMTAEDQEVELTTKPLCAVADEENKFSPISAQCHQDDVICPSVMLQQIKDDLKTLMLSPMDKEHWKSNLDVERRLFLLRETMTRRADITPPIFKALDTMCADWMAAVCVCFPCLVTCKAMKTFSELWLSRTQCGIFLKSSNLTVFVSPRTIMLLGQLRVEDQELAWKKLEDLLVEMVFTTKVMRLTTLHECFIALMRYSWPQDILASISNLIKNILSRSKNESDVTENCEAVQLMDWVGWVSSEMDILGDS